MGSEKTVRPWLIVERSVMKKLKWVENFLP